MISAVVEKKTSKIATFLLCFFSIIYVYIQVANILSDAIGNLLIASIGILGFIYCIYSLNQSIRTLLLACAIILSFLLVISITITGNANYSNVLWVWGYLGMAAILYFFKHKELVVTILFYVITIYLLYNCITNYADLAALVTRSSANALPSLSIFILFIYYYCVYLHKRLNVFFYPPLLLCLLISLISGTRGAVLACLFFFVAVFFLVISAESGKRMRNLIILSLSIVILFYLANNYILSDYDYLFDTIMGKVDNYGNKSSRSEIWSEYIDAAMSNIQNFLFGVPFHSIEYPILHEYDGNTHNAFFELHLKFGIIAFIFFMYNIIKSLIVSFKRVPFFFCLLLLIIIRSLFDWTAFPGIYDMFFWMCVFFNVFPKYCAE